MSFWVGRFGLKQNGLLARSHWGKISEGEGAAASLGAQESFGLEKTSTIIKSNCYPFWAFPLLWLCSSPTKQLEEPEGPSVDGSAPTPAPWSLGEQTGSSWTGGRTPAMKDLGSFDE